METHKSLIPTLISKSMGKWLVHVSLLNITTCIDKLYCLIKISMLTETMHFHYKNHIRVPLCHHTPKSKEPWILYNSWFTLRLLSSFYHVLKMVVWCPVVKLMFWEAHVYYMCNRGTRTHYQRPQVSTPLFWHTVFH